MSVIVTGSAAVAGGGGAEVIVSLAVVLYHFDYPIILYSYTYFITDIFSLFTFCSRVVVKPIPVIYIALHFEG